MNNFTNQQDNYKLRHFIKRALWIGILGIVVMPFCMAQAKVFLPLKDQGVKRICNQILTHLREKIYRRDVAEYANFDLEGFEALKVPPPTEADISSWMTSLISQHPQNKLIVTADFKPRKYDKNQDQEPDVTLPAGLMNYINVLLQAVNKRLKHEPAYFNSINIRWTDGNESYTSPFSSAQRFHEDGSPINILVTLRGQTTEISWGTKLFSIPVKVPFIISGMDRSAYIPPTVHKAPDFNNTPRLFIVIRFYKGVSSFGNRSEGSQHN